MRKFAIAWVVALAFVATVAALVPSLIGSDVIRQQVASQLSSLTGRSVSLSGDAPLRVFPNLSVEVTDLLIEGEEPGSENALLTAEGLQGRVRLLPLLSGRLSLSNVTLVRPTIQLRRDAGGRANWLVEGSGLRAALSPQSDVGDLALPDSVQITNGTVSYSDEAAGLTETLTGATLNLQWPGLSGRAFLSGDGIWRGEALDLSVSLDQPTALTQAGSTSGAIIALTANPLTLRFDGTLSPGTPHQSDADEEGATTRPWQLAGKLEASSPSLRSVGRWLGQPDSLVGLFGSLDLEADMNMVGYTMDLTDIALSVDGNEADGVLTFTFPDAAESQFAAQGTLDFDRLDVSAYLDGARRTSTVSAPGEWLFVSMPNVFSMGMMLDLRLATRQFEAAPLAFGETAGSIFLTNERMVLGIAEATAYGGALGGSLTVARGLGADPLDGSTLALDLAIDALQLEPLIATLTEDGGMAGALQLNATVSATGPTLDQLVKSVAGTVDLSITDASVRDINLDALASELVTAGTDEPLSAQGSSQIERFEAKLAASQGSIIIESAQAETEDVRFDLRGETALSTGMLALSGSVFSREEDDTPIAGVTIGGSWSAPEIMRSVLDGQN